MPVSCLLRLGWCRSHRRPGSLRPAGAL